ncbi:MAG: shikimate kinase [Patescibacteria group bacterium]
MNITLIGMPGAGKSTIGKKLAKKLNYEFIDIDRIIEQRTKLTLQQIIDNQGDEEFLKIEQEAVLELGKLKNYVISPGGSVIYLPKAMRFLKENSVVVFLDISFANIQKRLRDQSTRGIVGIKGKNLKTIFQERQILYKKYAEVIVSIADDFAADLTVENIIRKIQYPLASK